MAESVWLIPAFPLAGFAILVIDRRRRARRWSGWLASGAMAGAFAASVAAFADLLRRPAEDRLVTTSLFEWMPVGDLEVNAGFLADPLSVTMALFVTGVGLLIHLYSIGYMAGDERFRTYFAYLNLFAFSMLVLVLGDNLLVTFAGWEGVGACSYLLISFWFGDEANATAGKKAFVTNRVGDWGFMVAIFAAFAATGSVAYLDLFEAAGDLPALTATAVALLLFVGAAGKSAQFPLQLWLPDAMAGPTPVSALIHAATMVTAGVYLLVRVNPVLDAAAAWAPDLIAWVGAATALLAALAAVAQNDIKKVLAYSTISQLGYMVLAAGTGAYVAAVFHMVTHAFFKALLFLGAGSVIHATDGDQDMRGYGGLAKLMPVTASTFVVGWLAIAGVPPLSGFWSKDEILAHAFDRHPALWAAGLAAAVVTAFYMSRLVFMTFFGPSRWGADRHPHESPPVMTAPLAVLAGAALLAGGLNLPFTGDLHFLGHWLEPSLFGHEAHLGLGAGAQWLLGLIAAAGAAAGIGAASAFYRTGRADPARLERPVLARAFGYDSAVAGFVGGPGRRGFEAVAAFDAAVVDGAVDGTGRLVRAAGERLRRLQSGFVRSYAAIVGVGAAALLFWFLTRSTL